MRKLLSEDIRRAGAALEDVGERDLKRWEAMAVSMESSIAAARSLLDEFEPDDTYGAMIKMSVIDALEEG